MVRCLPARRDEHFLRIPTINTTQNAATLIVRRLPLYTGQLGSTRNAATTGCTADYRFKNERGLNDNTIHAQRRTTIFTMSPTGVFQIEPRDEPLSPSLINGS